MNAIAAFSGSSLSVLKNAKARRLWSILLNPRGKPLFSDTYGHYEIFKTSGCCGSNSVGIFWCGNRPGSAKHHHRLRPEIHVVRTRERQLHIPRNRLGGVRCGPTHLAVGDVDSSEDLYKWGRLLCRRCFAGRSRIRLRQVMLGEGGCL